MAGELRGAVPAPRALRYVVLAGGRPIGYGVPSRDQRSVRTVTADRIVLTAPVTVRYGDGGSMGAPPGTPEAPSVDAPAASGRRSGPGGLGPYEVTRKVYDFGDQVFQPSDLGGKVELTADVHYPKGLPDGPYPLVLFLHGNHSTCYRGDRARFEWPCRARRRPIPNYTGYDYIAGRLASHGFIVVSASANGVNVLGSFLDDTGMRQRGELVEKHLDLWQAWATTGAERFGDRFVGKVDLSRIGTMGHSRGGEGVVWHVIVDRERADPYGIDAVLPLAPVDFTRTTINGVPLAVVLPYCDGDVSDLQGVHFFDDARYRVPGDVTAKHTVTAFGANHNFFNTVWSPSSGFPGAFDDGFRSCPERLTEAQQRRVGMAYVVGFFRRYVAGTTSLDPMWTGESTPASIAPARTLVSYLAPDTAARRMDVDRFTDALDLSRGELGGAVTPHRLSTFGWCANTFEIPCVPGRLAFMDVHLPGLAQAVLGWSDHRASVRFELPAGQRDVHGFDAFQFRAAVNPGYGVNQGVRFQDLLVVLVDGAGQRAKVAASDVGNEALEAPFVSRRFIGHMIMNQMRFPLDRFVGVDLNDVRSVTLRFSRTRAGVVDVVDLAFTRGVA